MSNKIDYYKWNKYRVSKKSDLPLGSHMHVLVFTTRSECTPAYDQHDTNTYYSVAEVQLYVFADAQTLGDFIIEVTKAELPFCFYEVKKLGTAKISVSVDLKP